MNIGIIGNGFVGNALGTVLEKRHSVACYDKYKPGYKDVGVLADVELVFVCVPTPMKKSGEMSSECIEDAVEVFATANRRGTVVIKSTVVPGTTGRLSERYRDFDFAFNPEFLRESHAIEDMKNTNRVVIGTDATEVYDLIAKVYRPVLPNATYFKTSIVTAEMIKYAANTMLAGQIALANELYQICEHLGATYEAVTKVLGLDERIGKNISVPGPDGYPGFGGKCFPKDLNALVYIARESGYRPYLLEEVWRTNVRLRENTDWLSIEGAVEKVE